VRFHAKDATVVKTDAFKNAITIKQAVIEDRNLGFGLIEEFAVNVDLERFLRRSGGRGGLPRRDSFGLWFGDRSGFGVFGKHEKTSRVSKSIQAEKTTGVSNDTGKEHATRIEVRDPRSAKLLCQSRFAVVR
jgi:hypothetical protein